MSYVVLARRYRPQKFQDLVGQEAVAQTLKNAVKLGRMAHAYLFTGPRGVGKTSAARILAKAIRCLSPLEDGEPCNQCEACTSVVDGNSLDVIEIDAASNTGVDNIRELRENVEYMATVGKFRVYIIDEVHMLSTAAFNALLKTLEEPPPHVIFIFATTELHKVLPTIQSRCQRFDFKKIPFEAMSKNLRDICSQEGVEIDEASLRAIAIESDGCLRDAQSLLDQAIAFCGKKVQIEGLDEALGLLNRGGLFQLMSEIVRHETGPALAKAVELMDRGVDPRVLLNRITDFVRDLHFRYFTKTLSTPDPDFEAFFEKHQNHLSVDELVRRLDLSLKLQSGLYSTSNSRIAVEGLIVRMALQRPVGASPTLNSQSSAQNFSAPRQGASMASSTPPASRGADSPRRTENLSSPETRVTTPEAARPSSSEALDLRQQLENYFRAKKPAWGPVMQSLVQLEQDPEGNIIAQVRADFAGKRLASEDGIEILKTCFGVKSARVEFAKVGAAQTASRDGKAPALSPRDVANMARQHEAVKAAEKVFEARVTDTKLLKRDN